MSVHLIPWQASQTLSIARYATGTATEIRTSARFKPSPNQHLLAGSRHAIYKPLNQQHIKGRCLHGLCAYESDSIGYGYLRIIFASLPCSQIYIPKLVHSINSLRLCPFSVGITQHNYIDCDILNHSLHFTFQWSQKYILLLMCSLFHILHAKSMLSVLSNMDFISFCNRIRSYLRWEYACAGQSLRFAWLARVSLHNFCSVFKLQNFSNLNPILS